MNKANLEKLCDHMDALAGRWEDEKEYEDFNDYIANAKTVCATIGVEFVKFTKKPFALTVCEEKIGDTIITVSGTKINVTTKPISAALTSALKIAAEQTAAKQAQQAAPTQPAKEKTMTAKKTTKPAAKKTAPAPKKVAAKKAPAKVAAKPAAKADGKKMTISSVIIASLKKGLSPQDTLAAVMKAFPEAKTSIKCCYWFKSKLNCGHIE